MTSVRFLSSLILAVPLALGLASCSDGAQDEGGVSGSLSLELVIADDVEIDAVDWAITGGEMDPMSGTINTSAPESTASVEVFGLPPTDEEPYTITMEATSNDGDVTCRGSEEFDVEVGEVTQIMVMLSCKRASNLGAVRVNGEFNTCAELTKVVSSPLQTSSSYTISLAAEAVDADGDDIEFEWTPQAGTVEDRFAPSTIYTCVQPGNHFIRIDASDDGFRECISSWRVLVRCVELDIVD